MLLVPITEDTDFIVLVFIKIEPVLLAISQLQKVIIQGFLGYTYLLCCIFKGYTLVHIQPPPFTYLYYDFSYDPFLLSSATTSLTLSGSTLDKGIGVFALCFFPEFDLNLIHRRWNLVFRIMLRIRKYQQI